MEMEVFRGSEDYVVIPKSALNEDQLKKVEMIARAAGLHSSVQDRKVIVLDNRSRRYVDFLNLVLEEERAVKRILHREEEEKKYGPPRRNPDGSPIRR